MAQQGSLELLNDPVAKALLGSANPARLSYTWMAVPGSSRSGFTGPVISLS